jgi:hypothetical protein
VFIRNYKEVDNCALDTYNLPYPSVPTAARIQKLSGFGNSWLELSILFGRLELLITGGLFGEVGDDHIHGFLGPSIKCIQKLNHQVTDKIKFEILLPSTIQPTIMEERLQRNYSKSASSFKWSYHSHKFAQKGYRTLNPLYIDEDSVAGISSYIVCCVSKKIFNQDDFDHLIMKIKKTSKITEDMLPITDDLNFLKRVEDNTEKTKNLVVTCIINLGTGLFINNGMDPQQIINGETATNLYNQAIKYKCESSNKKVIQLKVYLK